MRQAGIEGWLKTLTEPNTVPVTWNRADLSSAPCLKAACVFYTKQSEKGVGFPVSEDDSGREIPNFWTLINLKCLLARSVQHLKKYGSSGTYLSTFGVPLQERYPLGSSFAAMDIGTFRVTILVLAPKSLFKSGPNYLATLRFLPIT